MATISLCWNTNTDAVTSCEKAQYPPLQEPPTTGNPIALLLIVSFAAVIGVVTQRSSPLTAAHERDTFLSLKLTSKKQASIFWKPGPSTSPLLESKQADLSFSFSKVCEQFKFSELNKHQKEAIISAVLKKRTYSLVYQPAWKIFQALPMVFDGFTGESGHIVIVVSPLLSLTKDQTERLPQVGISCVSLSDTSTQGEIDLVEGGFYSLVYATPESLLKNERWRRMLTRKLVGVADNNNMHSIVSQKQRERNVSLS